MIKVDVIIIGAGASGLMCAATSAYRDRQTLILDHADKPGKKLLLCGGGKCNFTNTDINHKNFISANPHFCKSALSRFSSENFVNLVDRHYIDFEERKHGQLFCKNSAQDILDMLLLECTWAGAKIKFNQQIIDIKYTDNSFIIITETSKYRCESLVIATGGLSIPKIGATPFGYRIAEQFNIPVQQTRAGLVPLTWHKEDKILYEKLSGISVMSEVSTQDGFSYMENVLFTHRGLSGPAILQSSLHWNPGKSISLNLIPDIDLHESILQLTIEHPDQGIKKAIYRFLPKKLVDLIFELKNIDNCTLGNISKQKISALSKMLSNWKITPNGTEGYRTAEITIGGVNTNYISSKTMESTSTPRLFFIGEVLDVTGWLGGYNLQWAWSSGYCCGMHA